MTLKEYIENLQDFVKAYPSSLDLQVITSIDSEGNGYNPVYFAPSIGIYGDNEFINKESMEEMERNESEINAVCVN